MSTATHMRDVKLEDLSDNEFRDLVDREIRKDHPQTPRDEQARLNAISPKLRHPAVINRWVTALEIMKASAETQLGAKRSELKKLHGTISDEDYLERVRKYQGWKAGNVRFLNSVQQRLLEARYHRMRQFGIMFPTEVIAERNRASDAVLALIGAIQIHKMTVLGEYDPTEADEALWASVEATVKEQL